MSIRERLANWISPPKEKKKKKFRSAYQAADFSRLTADLASNSEFINNTLRYELRTLRARSRQAAMNNPHARRFFQMVVDNVCGPIPFRLQVKLKNNAGKLDSITNRKIEDAWRAWGKVGSCDVTGRFSWTTLQRLIIRGLAIDGEVLLRRVMDGKVYRLQIIDVDRLNEQKNEKLAVGAINLGIETDDAGRPVAYHLFKRKPSTWAGGVWRESERVPASDILHLFIPEFAEQARGVPWLYAALINLVNLGAFEEAAVIAARVGASQMGFITSPDGGSSLEIDGEDAAGNPMIEADPGQFPMLPPGYEVSGWNPKYPDAAIGPFIKALLRGVSSGLNVAYHNLSGDMEGVNYSSARIAELDERDSWMSLQNFVAEHLHQKVYEQWLEFSVASNALSLPSANTSRYVDVKWQPRRWTWVDPKGEVAANIDAINAKLKSRTQIIAEQGEDIEDVFEEIAEENALAENIGIDLDSQDQADQTQQQPDAGLAEIEAIKARADAYGISVRAGAVTPQIEDEQSFRAIAGLQPMSSQVTAAWAEDGGVRRPITLSSAKKDIANNGDQQSEQPKETATENTDGEDAADQASES